MISINIFFFAISFAQAGLCSEWFKESCLNVRVSKSEGLRRIEADKELV